tara:strand:+ start:186 stop:1913 length:1728 start_codon:yes stop_codon:yes gene_type:complete
MQDIFDLTSPLTMSNGGDISKIKVPKGNVKLADATGSLATSVDAIGSGDLVRDTTRIRNLLNGSKVTRSFGYDEVFEVFKDAKSGINKAQIESFKDVPKVENFIKDGVLDSDKYNKAMKKFNKDVISKLDKKALEVLRSSGYLADYAQDSRISILEKGLKFGKDGKVLRDANGKPIIKKGYGKVISINPKNGLPVISKAFESQYLADNFDFVFASPGSAKGVKTKNFQSKVFTDIQKWGKKNLNKAKQLTLDIALAQINRLPGKQKVAALTALLSTIATKGFAKAMPVVGPMSTAADIATLTKTFGPDIVEGIQSGLDTVTEPVTSKIAEAQSMFENMLKSKMNQGGMMDINYMTRPLGYKDGTRGGSTVGDLEKLTNSTRANIQDVIAKNVKGQLNEAELKAISDSIPDTLELLKLGPPPVGSMARVTDLLKTVSDTFGQLNEKEKEMIKGESQDPSVTAIDTLRSLAASEVYNSMMNREGVDSTKIAGAFLRRQGIPTNDQSMGAIINLLDSQIIPQEQLKLMKEGQSTLEKGMDMGARGIESLLDMLGISESTKFRDMDRNILKELKDLRTN